jgi:hypothetical protein
MSNINEFSVVIKPRSAVRGVLGTDAGGVCHHHHAIDRFGAHQVGGRGEIDEATRR